MPIKGGALKLVYGSGKSLLEYHLVYVVEVTQEGVKVLGNYLNGVNEPYMEIIAHSDPRILGYWNPDI